MNREEREQMVDRLLSEALSPQAVEPRPGLEERILASLNAQPAPRPWWRWAWVPVAAAVILAIGLYVTRRPQPAAPPVAHTMPAVTPAVTPQPTPAPQSALAKKPRLRPVLRPRIVAVTKPLPRQEVFPSPVPLTEEEKLLLALRSRHPAEVVEVAQAQQAERERLQKYLETGEAPEPQPAPAREMR